PEAVALCSLAVLLGVPLLTGHAQWYEILAVLVGVALIAVELFLLPGFGLAGVSGIILVLAGLTMAFVPAPQLPQGPVSFRFPWEILQGALVAILGGIVGGMVLIWWFGRYMPTLPYFRGLVLEGV